MIRVFREYPLRFNEEYVQPMREELKVLKVEDEDVTIGSVVLSREKVGDLVHYPAPHK